jgi:serine/threonine protein kinase
VSYTSLTSTTATGLNLYTLQQDLLSIMLSPDPRERMTAEKLLKHPFLQYRHYWHKPTPATAFPAPSTLPLSLGRDNSVPDLSRCSSQSCYDATTLGTPMLSGLSDVTDDVLHNDSSNNSSTYKSHNDSSNNSSVYKSSVGSGGHSTTSASTSSTTLSAYRHQWRKQHSSTSSMSTDNSGSSSSLRVPSTGAPRGGAGFMFHRADSGNTSLALSSTFVQEKDESSNKSSSNAHSGPNSNDSSSSTDFVGARVSTSTVLNDSSADGISVAWETECESARTALLLSTHRKVSCSTVLLKLTIILPAHYCHTA